MMFDVGDVTFDEALEITEKMLFFLADRLKETKPYATKSIKVYEDAAHAIPMNMEALNEE